MIFKTIEEYDKWIKERPLPTNKTFLVSGRVLMELYRRRQEKENLLPSKFEHSKELTNDD